MPEIINLKRVKKQRARAAKEKDAAANREKHGASTQEKDLEAAKKALRDRYLDSLKKDD